MISPAKIAVSPTVIPTKVGIQNPPILKYIRKSISNPLDKP